MEDLVKEEGLRQLRREVRFQEEEVLEEDGIPSTRMTRVEKLIISNWELNSSKPQQKLPARNGQMFHRSDLLVLHSM
jgi:hypothetical protein